MKLPRREFLHLAVGAAALPAASQMARAQAHPTRPLRWIVGFPPGGGADTVARIAGQWLSDRLGQPVINVPMTAVGSHTRSFGDVGSMSGLPESGVLARPNLPTPYCDVGQL